jgi:hypothetical protein
MFVFMALFCPGSVKMKNGCLGVASRLLAHSHPKPANFGNNKVTPSSQGEFPLRQRLELWNTGHVLDIFISLNGAHSYEPDQSCFQFRKVAGFELNFDPSWLILSGR